MSKFQFNLNLLCTDAKSLHLQLCVTPPGFTVPGVLQARTLKWVASSLSNACKWKVKVKLCPTLHDPVDCSLRGSSVHVICQARVLERVAIDYEGPKSQSSSVQFSSVTQPCLTLCDPINHSTPGLPVHHQRMEFTQTHVHWVGDAIQPSHPLSSPSPLVLNLSQHQSLSQWVGFSHQVAKVWEYPKFKL